MNKQQTNQKRDILKKKNDLSEEVTFRLKPMQRSSEIG